MNKKEKGGGLGSPGGEDSEHEQVGFLYDTCPYVKWAGEPDTMKIWWEHDDNKNVQEFTLTPRTEAKYNKIDEEFHLMMQRNQVNGVRVITMMTMEMMTMMMTMMVMTNLNSENLQTVVHFCDGGVP